jgi:hypothetical protein
MKFQKIKSKFQKTIKTKNYNFLTDISKIQFLRSTLKAIVLK